MGNLEGYLHSILPDAELVSVEALPADHASAANWKAVGYVQPLLLTVLEAGRTRHLVMRFGRPDEFGHDRRSDRAQRFLLASDTVAEIPAHVKILDVGAIVNDRELVSLRGSGEFYLLSEYWSGTPYANDLRRVAAEGHVKPLDLERCAALARFLVHLHGSHLGAPGGYRRSIRDLLGHGEGIFGIIDGYPENVGGVCAERLQGIESRCLEWRWRLRGHEARLTRLHGDFHPFNILFGDGASFELLGAARGCAGDPADDVCALGINFPFFALGTPEAWPKGLGRLWQHFWSTYLSESRDDLLLSVAAPFLAWRGLVLANPRFYPGLPDRDRDRLLGFVEKVLDQDRFDPASVDALFR